MKKVLIVTSNFSTQRVFSSFLSDDYSITLCNNEVDAINILEGDEFQFVLIDFTCDKLNSDAFLNYIQNTKKLDNQPISVILNKQDLQKEIDLINMGCSEIFTPPFDSIITRRRIQNIITLSDLKKNVAVYEQKLITDPLTGLYNKDGFQIKVRKLLKLKNPGAFLMCDLDGLKYINDNFSHQIGDNIIAGLGKCLEAMMPEDSYIAHFSGDEFCVYIPNIVNKETLSDYFTKFQKKLLSQVILPDLSRPVTVSMGISLYPESATSYESLQSKADHAMLYVKNHGKNGFKFHAPRDDREELLKGRQECTSVSKEIMLKKRDGEENQIWLKFGEFRIVYITYDKFSKTQLKAEFCLLNIIDKENPDNPDSKKITMINDKITNFIKDAQYPGIFSWYSMNQLLILTTKQETLPKGIEHMKEELEHELTALRLDITLER